MLMEIVTSGRVGSLLRCMGLLHSSKGCGPCVLQGSEAMLQLLLAHGAEPNARPGFGNTALGLACERGYSSCVRLLLKAGGDVAMDSTLYMSHQGYVDGTLLQIAAEAGHPQVRPFLDMPVAFSWTVYVFFPKFAVLLAGN